MEKFKFILATVLVALLLGNSARGQLPTIYFDFYSGSQTTGTINVQVRNAANALVYSGVYSNVTQNAGFKYTPTAVGTYTVSVINNGTAALNSTLCQIDGCYGFVKEQACGVGNAPNPRVSSGPVSASSTYIYTLNITSRSDFGVKCSSALGTAFDYYVGGIYINSGFHTQVTCLDAPTATFTSNGNFVNDSTVSVAINTTLNLAAQCPSFYSSYSGEIDGYSVNPISEVVTADKVYKIRCKETAGSCYSDWRRVYVKAIAKCLINTPTTLITGITLNSNYTGANIFLIFGPANMSGTWKWIENGAIHSQGTYDQSSYNPTLGAYEVNPNRYNTGYPFTTTNPEIVNGVILATMGLTSYKVDFFYRGYGAFIAWPQDNGGVAVYNTVKPEGLSLSYTSCTNGQTRVIGSSEPRVTDNIQSGANGTKIQRLTPTLTTSVFPTYTNDIGSYANSSDGSWGAVWDLGMLNAGVTYTYRIIGTNGIAQGDYADISFTPTCPNPNISTPNGSICQGEKATLTVSGCASNICWDNGLTTTSISVVPTITTTYKVSCLTVDGDVNTALSTITVVNNTDVPVITASATTVAPSQAVTLNVTGCNGLVSWSHNPALTSTTTIVNPTQNTTYSVFCRSSSSNCRSVVSSVNIVTQITSPTVSSNVVEICKDGGTVALTASGCASTASYLWSNGSTTAAINVASVVSEYWVACVSGTLMSTRKYIKLKF